MPDVRRARLTLSSLQKRQGGNGLPRTARSVIYTRAVISLLFEIPEAAEQGAETSGAGRPSDCKFVSDGLIWRGGWRRMGRLGEIGYGKSAHRSICSRGHSWFAGG